MSKYVRASYEVSHCMIMFNCYFMFEKNCTSVTYVYHHRHLNTVAFRRATSAQHCR
jgi:hypothetical protein